MATLDAIENLSLIENGLLHLQFELVRTEPSFFRIAGESHLVLYRAMVEALRGSANLPLTGRTPRDHSAKYQLGDKPWQEIHRVAVNGCSRAWRFSEPKPCPEPIDVLSQAPVLTEADDHLIGFYDTLAMIQTECFMGRSVLSQAIPVSDRDMKKLEWLHERIRNEYEHFIPKLYMAPVEHLLRAGELCLDLSCKLLFESGDVLFHSVSRERLEEMSRGVLAGVRSRMGEDA